MPHLHGTEEGATALKGKPRQAVQHLSEGLRILRMGMLHPSTTGMGRESWDKLSPSLFDAVGELDDYFAKNP